MIFPATIIILPSRKCNFFYSFLIILVVLSFVASSVSHRQGAFVRSWIENLDIHKPLWL